MEFKEKGLRRFRMKKKGTSSTLAGLELSGEEKN